MLVMFTYNVVWNVEGKCNNSIFMKIFSQLLIHLLSHDVIPSNEFHFEWNSALNVVDIFAFITEM